MSFARTWTDDQDARFFDLIADDRPIAFAAKSVSKTKNAGMGRLDRVRRKYGWQAK